MMLERSKKQGCDANLELVKRSLNGQMEKRNK